MRKSKTPMLDAYKVVNVHRPQLPQILKFIDREFRVIYINLDAAPDANVVGWL